MAQPAPRRSEITPDAVVTLSEDGTPSQNPVSIPSGGSVQFSNPSSNTNDFLLQLWDKENKKHPVVSVYLAVGDDVIFKGDSEAGSQNARCPYNVITVQGGGQTASQVGPTATGGNNAIVVGSGNE